MVGRLLHYRLPIDPIETSTFRRSMLGLFWLRNVSHAVHDTHFRLRFPVTFLVLNVIINDLKIVPDHIWLIWIAVIFFMLFKVILISSLRVNISMLRLMCIYVIIQHIFHRVHQIVAELLNSFSFLCTTLQIRMVISNHVIHLIWLCLLCDTFEALKVVEVANNLIV